MDDDKSETIFGLIDLPEEHLNIDGLSKMENQRNDRNKSVQGSTQGFSKINRSATKHRNYNRTQTDQAGRNFSRNCTSIRNAEFGLQNYGVPRGRMAQAFSKFHDDTNDLSDAESTISKSSSVSTSSYPRPLLSIRTTRRNERGKFDRFNQNPSFNRPENLIDRDNENTFHPHYPLNKTNKPNERNTFNFPKKPTREQLIGYKYLKALSEKQPHEMICEILRKEAKLNVVLNRRELQADWIMLIMETVRKLCESDFKSNRAQVLQFFCDSPLLSHISQYLGEVGIEKNENTVKNLNSFVSDLVIFYSAVINTIPTVARDKNFDKFLSKTKIGIDQMKTYLNLKIDEAIVEKLANLEKILRDQINIRDKTVGRRKNLDLISDLPPPNDFHDLSLYPTEEDLNRRDFGFVRPNKIKGAYADVNHYLDVQFRLIREDFIDPLRRGLREYKDAVSNNGKPKYKYDNIRLYPNVQIKDLEVTSRNQVAYVMNFNANGRLKIKWEYSKRFLFGSLLILTRDNFESFFFATVFNRDPERLQKGQILVSLVGSEPLDPKMLNQPFLMAESEVYFEPYYLIMKALKESNEGDFPMKKFIVDGNTAVDFPQYIANPNNFYIYDYTVNLTDTTTCWPDHSLIGFDQHQFKAFRTALTSNFTVIQGPPGTGKTYLGLKIVEVLLKNIVHHDTFVRTPILLVCYTNHALDQFLEGILKFTQRIVRVGGQSKSELLAPYNLRGGKENLSERRNEARRVHPAISHCRERKDDFVRRIKEKTIQKKMVENPKGIVSYDMLSGVMRAEFKGIIRDDETLMIWLLDIRYYLNNPSFDPNNKKKNIKENVNVDPGEFVEIDETIFYEEDDDTREANLLHDRVDEFDFREVNAGNMTSYCVTLQELKKLSQRTQEQINLLKPDIFNDYSKYHNYVYQQREKRRIIDLQYNILNYHLQNSTLGSFVKFDPRYRNLWEIPLDLRWRIYWTWLSQLNPIYDEELKNLEAKYRLQYQQYDELKQLEDYYIVKDSLVVGMTTTCAARLQLLLKTMKPAIVIVEEAAEVLEAHIVVSLTKDCEHVILIGDHKQLKPSSAVYELSKKYNINVSLFERMINNDMYCPQLKIQHRMRPEISSLIVPSIYPNLKNHESVLEFPSVQGITKNLFFVEHSVYEEMVDDSSSRKNKFEAEFMIQLCRYILLQGYAAENVTILTTYTGQMFLIREMKREYSMMKDVKVIVVDKYQGEENDIILLSLVRSNEERKIGFLSTENRVCVALSRAKIGLYIVGNMDILLDSILWKNIKEELIKQEAIGSMLTLYCDKHDVHTQVSCKSDFNKVPEGGCHNLCNEVMDCGHVCQMSCHKIDLEHLQKKCREKCLKRCVENHPCQKYCYEECGKCFVPVERTLPCGHTIALACFIDHQTYQCQAEISIFLQRCAHEVIKKCYQSNNEVRCTFPCEDRLECGHRCTLNCHKDEDPDHLDYTCRKPCDKINRECTKEHKCEKQCFEDCGKCQVLVDFTLKCGHELNLECSANLNGIECYEPCSRKCSECNVTCRKKCYENCKPCNNQVTKIIPDCGHKKKIECSVVPKRNLCYEKCERIAPCGHKCKGVCRRECGTVRCTEMVKSSCVNSLCGHGFANVQCWRKYEAINAEELLQYCTEPCNTILKCGDLCAGTCGSCWQGRLHRMCQKKCGNVLVCGHSCTYPCRNVCPPCTQKCQYACTHSKCPKKCGEPCVQCREKCQWKCSHFRCTKNCGAICNRPPCYEPCKKKLPCKHDCIGFCGEPCPPKCRICDKEEVKTIVFGDEDEEDARFVLLEDCGHFIESKAMDKFMDMPADKGEIVMKLCPRCKTPISKTLRYMNQVKKIYQHIQNVKKKIYGNETEVIEIRVDLGQKLNKLDLRNDQLQTEELILIPDTVEKYKYELRKRGKQWQWNLPKQTLRAMHVFADMFSSIISRLDDLKKCPEIERSRILKRLNFILKHVNPGAQRINLQQIDETQKELNRYHRMVDYGVYVNKTMYQYNRHSSSPNVSSINDDIVEILHGMKCFDNEQNTRIGELFEKLREELKTFHTVSQEEKRMIHAAMAKDFHGGVNSQGHWFTCTKGHYYCITECGGATQESNCPECGERIGGTNHRYVDSAQVASDMDGATRPAWPNYSNIRNQRFNRLF